MAVVTPVADHERVSGIRIGRRFTAAPRDARGRNAAAALKTKPMIADEEEAARLALHLAALVN